MGGFDGVLKVVLVVVLGRVYVSDFEFARLGRMLRG